LRKHEELNLQKYVRIKSIIESLNFSVSLS